MRKETSLRDEIAVALRAMSAKVLVLQMGPFTPVGEPDILGCWRGHSFALETKRPERPAEHTLRQKRKLGEWRAAGARTGVAASVDDAIRIVRGLKKRCRP